MVTVGSQIRYERNGKTYSGLVHRVMGDRLYILCGGNRRRVHYISRSAVLDSI